MSDNDDIKGSFLERRNFIMQEIGKSFTKQSANQVIDKKATVVSVLTASCGLDNGKDVRVCENCLKLYYPDPTKVPVKDPTLLEIKKTACSGLCYCSISDVKFDQNIVINSQTKVDPASINVSQVATDVLEAIRTRYSDTDQEITEKMASDITNNVTQIVNQIIVQATTNINQVIFSLQKITLSGVGYNVSNINLGIMINATILAISGSNISLSLIDTIVRQQMDYIRNQVSTGFSTGFAQVLKESKIFLIATGVTIITLMLIIAGLLMYRAAYGHRTRR